MPKHVIVEWDSQQLRLASTRANGAVDHAWSVPLEDSSLETLGTALKSQVEDHRLHRADALVAISRRDVEVRELCIPPSPEAEHPDLVRMIAPREFAQFDETSVIDFYEIGRRDEMHCMLAASMDGGKLQKLKDIFTAAHLTPHWFALRPFCAAALLDHQPPTPRLIIDVATDQADISVHNGRQVLSVRNVQLPQENPGQSLQREVRRTLPVAANLLGKDVQEVVMFGSSEQRADLVGDWSLDLPLRFVDPCEVVASRMQLPDSGRFASLLGLAHVAEIGSSPWFDFLNPRQRPVERTRLTTPMLLGIVAATLLLAAGIVVLMNLRQLDNQVKRLSQELQQTKDKAVQAQQVMSHRDEVVAFMNSQVNWLDEMRRVSDKSLTYWDVTFTKWSGRSADTKGEEGGTLALDGGAKDADTIGDLQSALGKDGRSVDGRGHTQDLKNNVHPYRFRQLTVTIPPRSTLDDMEAEAAFNAQQGDDGADDAGPSSDPPDTSPPQKDASPPEAAEGAPVADASRREEVQS